MSWDWLRRAEGPWIRLAGADAGTLFDALKHEAHRRGLALRVLRGARMRTVEGLMDEFAAVCQLPPYFGRNWDALDECLGDLEIAGAEGAVLAILEADQLLAEAPPEGGRILFDLLQSAAAAYAGGPQPLPFHTVLQTDVEHLATVEEGLAALGVNAKRV